jgi:class 3 adenylate cyclase
VIETEPRPPVRAIVASFLFTDLVGFSKGSAKEQYAAKAALSACLRNNLGALREADYWIKDTGDGALIAFVSNPEHALYMALAIAQDYGHAADNAGVPLSGLRTGLHLGTVKETVDLEARRNYIGDGINATKRIMDFAAPGQIAASRNFFEAVANLDTEYAALFQHVGAPDDKHGRAHELYAIAPSAEVLNRLKLELTAAAPRPAEPSAPIPATIGVTPDPAVVFTDTRMPSNRAAEAIRLRFKPAMALIILVAVIAAIFLIMRRPETVVPAVKPVTIPSVTEPTSVKAPAPSPNLVGDRAAPTPSPPTMRSGTDGAAPAGTTKASHDAAIAPMTSPPVVAPTPTAKPTVDTTSRTPPTPAAPIRAPVAPEHGSPRCSQILEKAALGEPLSQEEKQELANSCH